MRGKTVKSPSGGENKLPTPSARHVGGTHGSGKTVKSSGDVMAGRPQYSSPTPDMKGRLFSHSPNKNGC